MKEKKSRRDRMVRRIVFTAINVAIPLALLLFVWTYSVEDGDILIAFNSHFRFFHSFPA